MAPAMNAMEIEKKVVSGSVAPAYLVFGEEQYWHRKVISVLSQRFGDGAESLAGDEIDWHALNDLLSQASFFGAKLWVVREAQELFSKDASPPMPKIALGNCLVLSCSTKDNPAGKDFLKVWAQEGFVVCEAGEPTFVQVLDWIDDRFSQRGFRILRDAKEELLAISGRSLERLENEVEKICLYLGGGNRDRSIDQQVTRSIVVACASRDPESNTFGFTDAIAAKNALRAAQELLELETRGYNPVLLVAVLSSHFSLMWRAKEAQDKKMAQSEMAKALGVHPYSARKAAAQASQWSYDEMENALRLLLDTDEGIKTGRTDPAIAMDHLIMSLCLPKTL